VLDPPASVIVTWVVCPVVCLPGRYSMEGDRLGLVGVEVESGKLLELLDRCDRVRRKGGQGWKRHFWLTAWWVLMV
jgi:hypothetical protein